MAGLLPAAKDPLSLSESTAYPRRLPCARAVGQPPERRCSAGKPLRQPTTTGPLRCFDHCPRPAPASWIDARGRTCGSSKSHLTHLSPHSSLSPHPTNLAPPTPPPA